MTYGAARGTKEVPSAPCRTVRRRRVLMDFLPEAVGLPFSAWRWVMSDISSGDSLPMSPPASPTRVAKTRIAGATRIAEDIGAAIVAGRYRPDELVPGELELSRRFGASRPVVREALKLLSAKGLISSRKRAGTRARPREAWHMLDADVLAWRLKDGKAEPKFVQDLLHARAVIEPASAAMAARSRTAQSLKAISAAFADMEKTVHDPALFAEPDIRFHRAILAATNNDFIAAFGALIEIALGAFVRIASRHPGAPGPSVPL